MMAEVLSSLVRTFETIFDENSSSDGWRIMSHSYCTLKGIVKYEADQRRYQSKAILKPVLLKECFFSSFSVYFHKTIYV
jgi:hypothetical protein